MEEPLNFIDINSYLEGMEAEATKPLTDEEYLAPMSNKEILAQVFLGILRLVPTKETKEGYAIELELQRKLKFNHIEDYKLLRSCIDLLEDTEYAILDYQEFGLGCDGRLGEPYLRLNGILNSVYQQIFAVIELAGLFNFQRKSVIIKELKCLGIFELRNKLAAHTLNFQIEKASKPTRENLDFFRVAQGTVKRWGEQLLVIANRAEPETVNLKHLLADYRKYSDTVLFDICNKALLSIFPNEGKSRQWLQFRLDTVKARLKENSNSQ